MKKALTILLLAAVAVGAKAQGFEDAFRYSQQFPVGTARTVAMGNAFTALGGDLGAMGINPASTALYNSCEFAVTPSLTWNSTHSNTEYYNAYGRDNRNTKFSVPNVAVVFALPTGRSNKLVSWSVGFGVNKTNNFNSHISYNGLDGSSSLLGNIASGLNGVPSATVDSDDAYESGIIPAQTLLAWDTWLIDTGFTDEDYMGATENVYEDEYGKYPDVAGDLSKSFDRVTSGSMYNIQMNLGLNFSDQLYLGANLNVYTVNYMESVSYSETADRPEHFASGFTFMENSLSQETSGSGGNLQLGMIWTPFPAVRFGATYTTSTLYELSNRWYEVMSSGFNPNEFGYESKSKSCAPEYPFSYQVKSPARYSLGAAFVLGNRGLISLDYEHVAYSKTRMKDEDGYEGVFAFDNEVLKCFNPCDIVRLGAEFNVNSALALRAGYNSYMFTEPEYQFLSFGIGKKISETAGIDLAFRTNLGKTYHHQPYADYDVVTVKGAEVSEYNRELLLTYKVKF